MLNHQGWRTSHRIVHFKAIGRQFLIFECTDVGLVLRELRMSRCDPPLRSSRASDFSLAASHRRFKSVCKQRLNFVGADIDRPFEYTIGAIEGIGTQSVGVVAGIAHR